MDADLLADAAEAVAREMWRASPHLEMGRELGIASWEALWADFTGGHPRLGEVRDWAPAYRLAVWRRALEVCGGDPDQAPWLAEAYIRHQRSGHPEIPGALDLVRRLHQRHRPVGILTNGPPDIQRHKLQQLGIDDCLSSVVISGQAGLGKPDPRVFELVLEGLGAAADDAVMIGDSWTRDVEGATAAGLRSIWISNGREPQRDIQSVSVVTTTPQAGALLGC